MLINSADNPPGGRVLGSGGGEVGVPASLNTPLGPGRGAALVVGIGAESTSWLATLADSAIN